MRLIDADELRRKMCYKCIDTNEETEKGRVKWDSGLWIRYKVFEDTLNLAPTVDAEPIRHGHWIKRTKAHPDLPNDSTYNYTCSNCGYWDTHGANVEVPYCWHCGAKMDEEEETWKI